jgi:hypothetical protein
MPLRKSTKKGSSYNIILNPSVDAGCKSLISICSSKIAGAPIGSPQFLGSREESMACALCHFGVTDSGLNQRVTLIGVLLETLDLEYRDILSGMMKFQS